MKRYFWLISGLMLLLVGYFGQPKQVQADISDISATPMIEDNDVTDRFQLIVQPNETRNITISFTNYSDAAQTIMVQPTNASTSASGKIQYTTIIKPGQNNLKYAFANMSEAKKITLKAQSTKDVTFKIKIPSGRFKGLILGGYNIYQTAQKNNPNRSQVAIPVYITETNKAVGGVLILKNINAAATNGQPHLYANLSNNQPGLMKNIDVHMVIERKGLAEFFHLGLKAMTADQHYNTVAPNSTVPIGFNQKQTPIKAGTYVVNGTATSGKTKWKFSGKYHISKAQAAKVNKQSTNLIYDKTWIFLLVIGGVVLLIILLVVLIRVQGRKNRN
ncbi:WxL protein peptidoglycan domain-containing protein [Agrilactobacillus yilanensis]|uniref:WxL protein peptidoglycan domain-containing protein n=1 Tax=Agrilactobacillus yilanensis TaxID=2485997 RepID=A0ABW4J9G4_9LACO|nr:DUF916 domain-containing protein [Agrilactobacillus yilanensis]